ncbi:hypothetical protein AK88_03968 [Plasmodium fragile]|uniref:Uncharacterized protein n=1 Tax=Plasmodium fragile TaxID=5857 RepID=A0A0D9QH63_PLAFR|nr:uncharacterized protein AK88_03968 [Plasmodium fragile]KJP86415.1 hypothetical protein AK88_03968 [Plasmodium fragile]
MTKVKIKKKFKHSGTLEEDLKNNVVTKNKIFKKKKKGTKAASEKKTKKKRKDDVQKILNLANRQNEEDLDFSDYGNSISGDDVDGDGSQQVDKFLQFDDDIGGEEGFNDDDDVSHRENFMADKMVLSAQEISHYDTNGMDESNNILDDLDVKINPLGIERGAKLDNGKEVKAETSEQVITTSSSRCGIRTKKKCYQTDKKNSVGDGRQSANCKRAYVKRPSPKKQFYFLKTSTHRWRFRICSEICAHERLRCE